MKDCSKAIELNPTKAHLYFMKASAEKILGWKDATFEDLRLYEFYKNQSANMS